MIQNFTYHCHTNFSDGENTAEDMINKAIELGFSHIGISDHLIVHKNIEQSPSWPIMVSRSDCHIYKTNFHTSLPEYQKHCEELRSLSKKKNFRILIGFEVDFFTYNGWLEEFKEFLQQLDYDYIISGNHFLFSDDCETIYNIDKRLSSIIDKPKIKKLISNHFRTIADSTHCGLFKFVAHLDYVRKMGPEFCSDNDYIDEKYSIVEALTKNGVGTEISTKGLRKIGDFYPNEWFLKELAKNGVQMIISDDAHRIEELGYSFEKAEEKLKSLNILNRLKL